MNTVSRLLCLLPLLASTAMAETYPTRTLIANSMICYKLGDWRDMIEASLDKDEDGAERLISTGKCRTISSPTKVSFIESNSDGKSALILLPSGKTAMTAIGWLR